MARQSIIIEPRTGQPFEMAVTRQKQTDEARLAGLHRRFDEHPSSGLTPYKLAYIMQCAEQGDITAQSELAIDMEEKDAHLFSELGKRRNALLDIEWKIEPPRNATTAEKKAAEFAWEYLDYLDMTDVIFDMADAILKGFSCQTIEWSLIDGYQVPVSVDFVQQTWFGVPQDNRNKLMIKTEQGELDELWPGGWIVHVHKSKSGYLPRNGLVRTLAWPYLFKNYSLRDLAEFLEIYGLPMRLGKYPSGASENEKAKLLQAVIEIGHNAAGIIPESMAIDFQNAANGQSDPFMSMIEWAERITSKALLGGTLTSGTDQGGAYALGNVHNEVRLDIRNADLRQIAATLTRDLIFPLVAFNQPGLTQFHRCPKFKFEVEEAEDTETLAATLPALQQAGVKISRKWLHNKTQIPEPLDESDTLQPLSVQPQAQAELTQQSGCQCHHCQTAALTSAPNGMTPADQISDQLQTAIDPLQTDLVEQLRDLVNQAESFEAIQNKLLELADQDMTQMAELLAQAMTLAELQGRYDVLNEALNPV